MHWVLWSHGGYLVDKDDKVIINSPETAKALEYVKQLYETFIPGTASWNDSSNNKAFLAGELHLHRQRHLDLRHRARRETPRSPRTWTTPIAGRARSASRPSCIWLPDADLQLHQVSRRPARRSPPSCWRPTQYNPWVEAAQGYLSQFLQRLRQQPGLDGGPEEHPYRDAAKRTLHAGGIGTVGEKAAAAIADFIVVDMFANYCTGREDVKGAIASPSGMKRIYRSA